MEKAGPYNNWHYNKKLKPLARAMRKDMTKAEACLWKYVLRAGQMNGYTFYKQRPVLNYIADFLCKELNLIIEVDGITHLDKTIIEKDEQKENNLRAVGFIVIRFRDEEVLNQIQSVIIEIEQTIETLVE